MKLKELIVGVCFVTLGIFISCGEVVIAETVDADLQLEEDIATIEAYIAEQGYLEYDTLESEVRVVILEEGTGDAINYEDFVWYDYIGSLIGDVTFDTSIASVAYEQDLIYLNLSDITLTEDSDGNLPYLDINGYQYFTDASYTDDYNAIYYAKRDYSPFQTTHSPGGWFIQQDDFIHGFRDGVHEILENVNLKGRGLMLIPSAEAYGTAGSSPIIDPNTPIMFEIRTVRKK